MLILFTALEVWLQPESVEFEVLPACNHLIALWILGNIRVDAIHPVGEVHVTPTAIVLTEHILAYTST